MQQQRQQAYPCEKSVPRVPSTRSLLPVVAFNILHLSNRGHHKNREITKSRSEEALRLGSQSGEQINKQSAHVPCRRLSAHHNRSSSNKQTTRGWGFGSASQFHSEFPVPKPVPLWGPVWLAKTTPRFRLKLPSGFFAFCDANLGEMLQNV